VDTADDRDGGGTRRPALEYLHATGYERARQ
jgi:hypothetical protein